MRQPVTHARAVVGALTRHRPQDDPDLAAAKRDLRAACAEAYIQELVAQAPPLTDEQRDKLVVLLRPTASSAA